MSLALLGTAAAWNDGRFTPTAIGVGIAAVALLFASLFTIFASAALFAGVLALLDEISNGAFFITMLFMMVFTPYVTFGGRIWTTWWKADNSDGFRLLRGTGWLYAHLHYRFASVCRVRDKQDQAFVSRLVAITGFPAAIIGILLSITTGRCLPVWLLIFLPTQVLYFTVNAVHVASRNALLDTVAGVYRDAQRELRMLAVAAGPGPLADAIGLHDAAIASFLEASRYRAKMFGFTVGYGTVRTFLVTLVTVAVALWGVLRGFGVFVTVESFCPSEP
ncbi:hypothetical protein DFJ74DRAFT_700676 [Hyaloraphidium curvatum]|nr:hypothetical protein DFJ74DRAFT_700676 [Hyaloraphidium curvatum]